MNSSSTKGKWDSLPKDLQDVIEEAAEFATYESWLRIGRLDMGAMEKFRKTGNEIIFLSPETQKRCHELGQEWAANIAKDNPWFKKVMDSQNAFEAEWLEGGQHKVFPVQVKPNGGRSGPLRGEVCPLYEQKAVSP